jgi:hypothetical protein
LLALKLDGLALIQALVAAGLDGGEMDEDIFSAGALNESVSLGSIEPLHDTLFFHFDLSLASKADSYAIFQTGGSRALCSFYGRNRIRMQEESEECMRSEKRRTRALRSEDAWFAAVR